jgi:hypothetical protein
MIEVGGLTFREYLIREPLPLSTIQSAILDFLRNREDAVLYGALAVNAYVDEPRMTQDADIASTRGLEFAEELRDYLAARFHVAVRVRDVREGLGYRLYQARKEGNRHLADVRPVDSLPPSELKGGSGGQTQGVYGSPRPGRAPAGVPGAQSRNRPGPSTSRSRWRQP